MVEVETRARCGTPARPASGAPAVVGLGAAASDVPAVADEGRPKIRTSRFGKRRAFVLGTVQLLMVLHVLHWVWTGRTLTPVEPSETVETLRDGVVNVGAIFFALTIVTTLVLGRWFCGWACHVVLLQDLCAWIMKRLGIRPRAFRSRLLPWVTAVLFLYMFVWPVARRWLVLAGYELGWLDEPMAPWQPSVHLTTDDFWRTFPPWYWAVPFLFLCGFVLVYFLGSKAYCTYGCPYGGCFAALDRLSPLRIRVTDACQQCGHCTAVCTSNVLVHQEVHDFGMVVDPGCMKCLDCVSVCPNDALYYGPGKPSAFRGASLYPVKPRRYDLTVREELVLFAVYWVAFLSVLGIYQVVPYLLASGVAALVTYLMWKGWRLLRERELTLHRFRLRREGRLTLAGAAFGLLVLVAGSFTLHSGVLQVLRVVVNRLTDDLQFDLGAAFTSQAPLLDAAQEQDAAVALACTKLLTGVSYGGIALAHDPSVDQIRAWLHTARREFEQAEPVMRRLVNSPRAAAPQAKMLGQTLVALGRDEQASAFYDEILLREPGWLGVADDAVALLLRRELPEQAVTLRRRLFAANPDNPRAATQLGVTLVEAGAVDEGLPLLRDALVADPSDARAQYAYGTALLERGELEAAHEALAAAARLDPSQPLVLRGMARVLRALGREDEAKIWAERARGQRGGVP